MATEGIAAALTLSKDIKEDLKTAQYRIDQMAVAAEKLGNGFSKISAGMSSMAKDIKGMNLDIKFDTNGTLKSIGVISDAVAKANQQGVRMNQEANRKKISDSKDAAEKQLAEYQKLIDKEVKYREKKTKQYERLFSGGDSQDAMDLSNKVTTALNNSPKNLEEMKRQLQVLKQLQAEMNRMKKNPYIDANLVQETKARIETLNNKIYETKTRLKEAGRGAENFKRIVGNAFSVVAVTNFMRNLIAIRGEFEIQERSLAVIIKDSTRAAAMFKEIEQIAVKSPFSVMEMVKQTKQLAAYRIETDKLIEKTKMLGDISAGVGVDINRLILAYGQVKSATFLKGQELRQFSEAGVNMLGGLAERFSEIYHRAVTTGEVLQMISNRMVKFADVDAVLKQQTEAGGAFYRMQEIQANTLQGAITNLKDRIQIAFNEMGKSYDGLMKAVVKALEAVIDKWEIFSNILIAGVGWKVASSGISLIVSGLTKLNNALPIVRRSIAEAGIAAAVAGKNMTSMTKTLTTMKGVMSGIGKALGASNILSLIITVGSVILNIVRNANELERTITRISKNIKETQSELVSRYESLMNVAADVTASEASRVKALEALKSEYGNILNLQNVELDNINKINDARAEQIALIQEYAIQQGREEAMTALIGKLSKTSEKRQAELWGKNGNGLESFIKNFKDQVRGLELIDEQTANSARNIIERKIIDGSIETAEQANKEFLKVILGYADATSEQIDSIMSSMGENSYVGITRAFDKVKSGVESISYLFEKEDLSVLPKTTVKYEELIKGFQNVSDEFKKANMEMFTNDLPGYKIALKGTLLEYRDTVRNAIDTGFFNGEFLGEISSTAKQALQKLLDTTFSGVSVESDVQLWVNRIVSEINKDFPDMRNKLGIGEMAFADGDSIEKYSDKLSKELTRLESLRSMLYPTNGEVPTEGEIMEVMAKYGGAVADQYQKANEEVIKLEAKELRLSKIAEGKKLSAREEARLQEINTKLAEARAKKEEILLSARASIGGELLTEIEAYERFIKEIGSGPDGTKDIKKSQQAIKDLSDETKNLAKEVINVGKEWESMSDKVREQTRKLLESSLNDIRNELDILGYAGIELSLPDLFTPDTVRAWIADIKAKMMAAGISPFSSEEELRFELSLVKWEEELRKEAAANSKKSASERQNNLKEFITNIKRAKKELDELNDKGDELLNEKLNIMAQEAGLKKKDETIDFINMSNEDLDKWLQLVNKLEDKDRIDIELTWSKDDLSDKIQKLSQEASELWDKYDTSKKFEEWGIRMAGMDSSSILNQIKNIEEELRKENTESSIKAADNIKQKRLSMLRKEQEDAAKIIYESQKKAVSKTEQIYQDLFENIAKIKKGTVVNEDNIGISKEDANKGILAATKKAFKEISEAEWDAYKSSEAYAMAFGDLAMLSDDVLTRLRDDLTYFKENNILNPTDIRSVENAISRINNQISNGSRGKEWFGTFINGFKSVSQAYRTYAEDMPVYERLYKVADDSYLDALDEVKKLKEKALANPGDIDILNKLAEAETNLAIAANLRADAEVKLKQIQEAASSTLGKAQNAINEMNSTYGQFGNSISEVIGLVEELSDAFGFTISEETQGALDGFQQGFGLVGSIITVATSAMLGLYAATKLFKIEIGTIIWPLLAVGAALGTVVAIIKSTDAKIVNKIEAHKEAVEKLQKAYEDLQSGMEEALSLNEIMSYNSSMISNLKQQYEELNEAITANNSRKQTDEVKEETKALEEQLDEVSQKMKEANEQKMELLGAPTNYQDVAKDWASSWLEAFKETGNGLSSLEDSFDDLYDNLIAAQIQTRIMGPAMKELQTLIDSALQDGKITREESDAIKKYRDSLKYVAEQQSEKLLDELGYTSSSSFEGDTLQKGIEGITEQTAQALESILNSTRYYVADNNRILLALESAFTGEEGENTILSNIRAQTKYLRSLATIADAVYYSGSHPKGAGGIKVFID